MKIRLNDIAFGILALIGCVFGIGYQFLGEEMIHDPNCWWNVVVPVCALLLILLTTRSAREETYAVQSHDS